MPSTGLTLTSHMVQNQSKRRSLSCRLSDRSESLKITVMVSSCNDTACITLRYVPGEHLPVSPGSVLIPVSEARNLFWMRKEGIRARKGENQDVRVSRSLGYHNYPAGIHHLKRIDLGFVKVPGLYWGLQQNCAKTQTRAR